MNLSLFNVIIVILFTVLFGWNNTVRNRRFYIWSLVIVFLLESSLRSIKVGADTISYYYMFKDINNLTWNEIWQSFVVRYFLGAEEESDVGYTMLVYTIRCFTDSFQVFETIRNLIFFIPLGIFLNKYSRNFYQLTFAFLFYAALLHSIPINGGRQILAMGFGIMSFMSLEEGKRNRAIIWLIAGIPFHMSILLCLIPIALSFLKPKIIKGLHAFSLLLIPAVILNVNSVIVFMGDMIGSEKYAKYGKGVVAGGTATFIILLTLLSIFCYFAFKTETLENNRLQRCMYLMLPPMSFFGPLIHSNGSMIRIVMYFYLYLMLMVPFGIETLFTKDTHRAVYYFMIGALAFLMITSGSHDYYFYWQK